MNSVDGARVLEDIATQGRRARESLEGSEGWRSGRRGSRSQRMEPPPAEAIEARRAAQAKELAARKTAALVDMARWGSIAGARVAVEEGADPSGAGVDGITPAVAAIHGGHPELALWLMQRPGYRWVGQRYPGSRFTELAEALARGQLGLAESVHALDTSQLEAPGAGGRGESQAESSLRLALARDARVAAWILAKAPRAAARLMEAAGGPDGDSGGMSPRALLEAIGAGDEASARALLDYLRPLLERSEGPRGLAAQAAALLLAEDDARGMAWLVERCPGLALAWASRLGGCGGRHPFGWLATIAEGSRAGLRARVARMSGGEAPGELRTAMAMWAAQAGAIGCLDFLLAMPLFARQVPLMQREPETYAWELACAVADPAAAERLERAGFDFGMPMADGWSYALARARAGESAFEERRSVESSRRVADRGQGREAAASRFERVDGNEAARPS